MDSIRVGVVEVGCCSMMWAHFEQPTDTYSCCSRWSWVPLSKSSKFLKLCTPTHQLHTEPVGNLKHVSIHPLLDFCFSSLPLVLCSPEQFFASPAYCFIVIDWMHDAYSFQPSSEMRDYNGCNSSLDKDQF